MKVLILGGTSFFGKDIARRFYEAGHTVTLFTRGNQLPADLPPHEHFRGDRNRMEDLLRVAAAGPWDVVVDNIAYDGDAVRNAATAFRGVGRYLLMSTVSIYRYVNIAYPQPLLEGGVDFAYTPPQEDLGDVHWKYARGKLEAERALIDQKELRWTILRPPVVYGPFDITDRGFWYLGRLLKGGPICLANGGNNAFRLVYSQDVARATVAAAEREKAVGAIYNVAQSEVITLRDFVLESARAYGLSPEIVNVPQEILGELGGPYASMINLISDIGAAQRDLGYHPTPFADFASSSALWFREHWKGDQAKLLETRQEELKIADRWKAVVSSWKN